MNINIKNFKQMTLCFIVSLRIFGPQEKSDT
jgi:hypothetical protein